MDAPPRSWAPGRLTLARAGVIDVWKADLAAIEDGLEDLLRADELIRAARIVPARKRVLWARSRGLLRALLGRYLERDPRELRFALGSHGKPALAREETDAGDLRFNLSHSGGLALVAVTAGREVGVDIERARDRYTAELLRVWVANEAVVKCRGIGLAKSSGTPFEELWTTELDVGLDATAAVAVEGRPCELRCYGW